MKLNIENIGSLVLVGAGQMGLAMVRGWLANGLDVKALTLVDPAPRETTKQFASANNILLVAEIPKVKADVVVLAVKPQIAKTVMASICDKISPDTLILSVVAGFSLKALKHGLGSGKIVRTMPNIPAQVGKGVSGAVAANGVDEKDRKLADELLGASGIVVWLENESQIDALTGVSGSGPAYVFFMVAAMAAAGEAEGLSAEMAMVLARQTIIGAAALMDADQTEAAILRKNVTSPNGTTAEALLVLMADDGLGPLMGRAIKAAAKRNREIGE